MIIKESVTVNGSSCGVFLSRIIHIYNKKKRFCHIGFFTLSSNKVVSRRRSFLRKKKKKSFFVRSKYNFFLNNFARLSCNFNTTVLLKKRLYVLGTVTIGPISRNIRRKRLLASYNYKFCYVL